MTNRTGLFYKEFTLAAAYTAANIENFVAQHTHIKMVQTGGDGEFTFSTVEAGGSSVEGKILSDEELNFDGMAQARIAVRGVGIMRVWGWHQT